MCRPIPRPLLLLLVVLADAVSGRFVFSRNSDGTFSLNQGEKRRASTGDHSDWDDFARKVSMGNRQTPSRIVQAPLDDEDLDVVQEFLKNKPINKTGQLRYSKLDSIQEDLVAELTAVIRDNQEYMLLLGSPSHNDTVNMIQKMIREPMQPVLKHQIRDKMAAVPAYYSKIYRPLNNNKSRSKTKKFLDHLKKAAESDTLTVKDAVVLKKKMNSLVYLLQEKSVAEELKEIALLLDAKKQTPASGKKTKAAKPISENDLKTAKPWEIQTDPTSAPQSTEATTTPSGVTDGTEKTSTPSEAMSKAIKPIAENDLKTAKPWEIPTDPTPSSPGSTNPTMSSDVPANSTDKVRVEEKTTVPQSLSSSRTTALPKTMSPKAVKSISNNDSINMKKSLKPISDNDLKTAKPWEMQTDPTASPKPASRTTTEGTGSDPTSSPKPASRTTTEATGSDPTSSPKPVRRTTTEATGSDPTSSPKPASRTTTEDTGTDLTSSPKPVRRTTTEATGSEPTSSPKPASRTTTEGTGTDLTSSPKPVRRTTTEGTGTDLTSSPKPVRRTTTEATGTTAEKKSSFSHVAKDYRMPPKNRSLPPSLFGTYDPKVGRFVAVTTPAGNVTASTESSTLSSEKTTTEYYSGTTTDK